jgi:hypothetical protein
MPNLVARWRQTAGRTVENVDCSGIGNVEDILSRRADGEIDVAVTVEVSGS